MKPSSFSSKKRTPTSLFVTEIKETPKKPLSIQEYLIEISIKLNVFLLAHGGPAWFFGPIQDFFKEKIGMVWDNQYAIPIRPYYHYSHFVFAPTQLYLPISRYYTS